MLLHILTVICVLLKALTVGACSLVVKKHSYVSIVVTTRNFTDYHECGFRIRSESARCYIIDLNKFSGFESQNSTVAITENVSDPRSNTRQFSRHQKSRCLPEVIATMNFSNSVQTLMNFSKCNRSWFLRQRFILSTPHSDLFLFYRYREQRHNQFSLSNRDDSPTGTDDCHVISICINNQCGKDCGINSAHCESFKLTVLLSSVTCGVVIFLVFILAIIRLYYKFKMHHGRPNPDSKEAALINALTNSNQTTKILPYCHRGYNMGRSAKTSTALYSAPKSSVSYPPSVPRSKDGEETTYARRMDSPINDSFYTSHIICAPQNITIYKLKDGSEFASSIHIRTSKKDRVFPPSVFKTRRNSGSRYREPLQKIRVPSLARSLLHKNLYLNTSNAQKKSFPSLKDSQTNLL